MSTDPTTPTTERRLIVRESDVCWLYPDGSHRRVTQADVDEINAIRDQVESLRIDLEGAAHNRFYDQRDAYFEGVENGR